MNNTSIKVIKRKDAKTWVTPTLAGAAGSEKTDRQSQRKMASTVSDWIAASRENNRGEGIAAIRRMLGGGKLSDKTG